MTKFGPLMSAVLLVFACGGEEPPPANADMDSDHDMIPAGEAVPLPADWSVRLDQADADPAGFRVTASEGSFQFQTGPAGIAYVAANNLTGDYTVSATFTEVGAPAGHREAMGLFVGGQDLTTPSQRYTYFLVRGDGSYLIKRRNGEGTLNVSDGWMEEASVRKAEGTGDVTNALSVVRVGAMVHFAVNGTQVATLPASEVDADGIAGVRINHNLNVRVDDWLVVR